MKVSFYVGQSMDGFIADVNGGIGWMETDNSASELLTKHYEKFLENIDILVMGYTTYNQLVTELTEEWPYPNHLTYVLTTEELDNLENVIFTNDIEEVMRNDKNIWLVGGATLAKSFIEKDYIDEYILTTVPVCIGDGIKLFNHVKIDNLQVTKVEQLKNYVAITYEKKS